MTTGTVGASWGTTFPGGTFYHAQLSSSPAFAGTVLATATQQSSWTFTGLAANATYYARVATAPAGPFTSLGSTVVVQFVRAELPGTAGYALRIGVGDLDGDGDLDAALAQATTLNETVLRNDGGGTFTQVAIAGSGGATTSLALCDLDSDGDLDILAGNESNQDEVVYRNNGALSFTKITLTGSGGNTKGVACGDYDSDGDLDAVVANDGGGSVVLLRNDGGLSFAVSTLPGTAADNRDVKWLDYDSDGDLDVFVAVSGQDAVLRNDGGGAFAKVPLAGSSDDTVRVALADFDLDGDLDAALSNYSGQKMALWRSDGAGTLSRLDLMSSTAAYDAVWGDYDGDGDADLLFGETAGDDFLARNDGGGVFTRVDLTGSKGNTNSAAWADFDGDGDLDALLGKALTSNAVLMRNDAGTVNDPPTAPGGVAASFAGFPSSAALTVTWSDAPYDGPRSTAGLSYALVAATAPMALAGGSMRVVSPSSFVVTWNHGTPPGGNAQKAGYRVWPGDAAYKHGMTFAVDLGGLLGANFKSDATYYFRLQTVDAGLARSTWSAEASAYLLRPSPSAALSVGSATASVSFSSSGAAGYLLRASTASDFSGALFTASAASAASSVALAGLSPATTYHFLFGTLWQRTTVWTAPTPSSAATAGLGPSLSSGPFAGVSQSGLTASWTSTFPGGTFYRAELSTSPAFAGTVLTTTTQQSSWTFTGLAANTTYYAQVSTFPAGPYTSLGSARTLGALPAVAVPSIEAAYFSSIAVRWEAGGNAPGTLFHVRVATSFFAVGAVHHLTTTDTWASVGGLSTDESYMARVSTTELGEFTYLGSTATHHYEPTSMTVIAVTSATATLSWSGGGNKQATTYSVQSATSADFTSPSFDGAYGTTTLVIKGLTHATSYYFRVRTSANYYSPSAYGLTTSTHTRPRPLSFSPPWTVPLSAPCQATFADFDADGRQDIAVSACESSDYAKRVYRQTTSGFQLFWTSPSSAASFGVDWGDFDRDGWPDLAFGHQGSSATLRVYRNLGGTAFSEVWSSTETDSNLAVRWGDFDNDGLPDLLAVNAASGGLSRTRVYRNRGDGTFADAWRVPGAAAYTSGAWCDFDDDGNLDLLLGSSETTEPLRVYRGDGQAFSAVYTSTENGVGYGVHCADGNRDGRLDFFTIRNNFGYPVRHYVNLGASFSVTPGASTGNAVRFALADIDNDGRLDHVSRHAGSGSIGAESAYLDAVTPVPTALWQSTFPYSSFIPNVYSSVELADANGDGMPDLLSAGRDGAAATVPALRLYTNNSPGMNVAPTPPQTGFSLTYDLAARRLEFSWDAGSDDKTPPAGLRYSLTASTVPGQSTLSGGFFPPSIGSYPSPQRLSSGRLGRVLIVDLPNGATVYWSVRAWDETGSSSAAGAIQSTVLEQFSLSALPLTVTSGAVGASWTSTFPGGTFYRAELSTSPAFAGTVLTTTTQQSSWTFTGLAANTTYYAQVATAPAGPYTSLGATATWVQAPTAVYFDEVSSHAIVAAAYAPTPAFTNLNAGLSGTNLAKDGVYAGWKGESWATLSSMTTARKFLGACAVEGRLYAVGGFAVTHSSAVESYNPATDSWTSHAALNPGRSNVACAAHQGRLYAVGGTVGGPSLVTVQAYAPASDSWVHVASMSAGRLSAPAASLGGKLYAVGGWSGSASIALTESFDASRNSWTILSPMPAGTSTGGAAAAGGRLFHVGGTTATNSMSTYAHRYDPALGGWATVSALPIGTNEPAVVSVGGKVFVLGGIKGVNDETDNTFEYDPAVDLWTSRSPLPFKRRAHAGAALAGRIHLIGGGTSASQLSGPHLAFDPGTARQFTGLLPNTQYTFKAKARNLLGVETGETASFSTYTLAAVPGPGAPSIAAIWVSSASLAWTANGNPGGTQYRLQASTASDFSSAASSTTGPWTAALSGSLTGLTPNTTWFFRVQARNAVGFETDYASLGASPTAIENPSAVYFDEVTTHSIVAAAYAPTPAFTNLNAGLSGTNLAKDGVYAGWHGEAWTTKAAMATARYGLAAAAAGGKLYAMGGYNSFPLTTNAEYDPVADAWTAKTAIPSATNAPGLAAYAGSVYLAGGEDTGGLLSALRRFDPAANSWTSQAALPSSRAGLGFVAVDGRLHSVGGLTGSGYTASNSAFDPAANVWNAKAALPFINHAMGHAVVGSKAYFVGGWDGTRLSSAAVYDAGGDSWALLSSAPVASDYPVLAAVGRKLYLIGGSDGSPLATNYEYDPAVDAWARRASMGTARSRPAGAAVNGRVYVVGGTNGSPLAANEEYDPGTARSFVGLTPNTPYSFKAKARNVAGVETGETASFSTYTHAAVPGTPSFSWVGSTSAALQWASGGNPAGTEYSAEVSYSSSFVPLSSTPWTADLTGYAFSDLVGRTTYYARVRARNAVGVATAYAAAASTRTQGPALRVWDGGGTTTSASEAANWEADALPVSGDSVWFNSASSKTCAWDLSIAVASFTIGHPYRSVLLYSDTTIADVVVTTGFFRPQNASTTTILSSLWVADRGQIQWDGGRVRLRGNMRVDSPVCCSFGVPYDAALELDGSAYQVVSGTGRVQLPLVEVNSSSEAAFLAGAAVEAKGLSLLSGTLRIGASGQLLTGGWSQTGGQFLPQASTVTLWNMTAPHLVTVQHLPGQPFANLAVGFGTNGIGYARALGPLEVTGSVTLTTGAFDGGSYTHQVGGDWTEPGGPSTMTGTLRLSGTAPRTLQFSTFTRLGTLEAVTPATVTVAGGSVLTVGTLTLGSPGLAQRISVRSSSSQPWHLNVLTTATVARAQVSRSYASGGRQIRAAFADNLDLGGNVNWLFDGTLSTGPFSAVSSGALTASWSHDFPAGTTFYAQASATSTFASGVVSSATVNAWASFSALSAGTVYHARVATTPAGPFTALGSTRTRFADGAGCALSLSVHQGGEGDCASIQGCLGLVPSSGWAGDACVVVQDSAVYSEQVTVSGKATGAFRLRLEAAAGQSPAVNPPAGSAAGLRILNSSVSVAGLVVRTTNTVAYGILVSSPGVALSSVSVDSGGRITTAGIQLGTATTLSFSSVTVQNADAVRIVGTLNTVSRTTGVVGAFSRGAFYLLGASSNTVQDSFGYGNPGYGAFLYHSAWNTLARSVLRKTSTSAGAAGLGFNDSSSNTLTGSVVSNANGTGAELAWLSDHNLLELSTFTAAGAVYTALEVGSGRGTRVRQVYAHGQNGSAATFSSGASESLVEQSTFSTDYAGGYALSTNGSSDTFRANLLLAPNGVGLGLFGSSTTVTLTTATTGSGSYPALYAAGAGNSSVRDSCFGNSGGDGGKLERASWIDIARSTLTGGSGGAALRLEGASSNTVTASLLSAPGGTGLSVGSYLDTFDMSTTTGANNAFAGLSVQASTAVFVGAAPGVALSSSVLRGDSQGAALAFGDAPLVATFTALAFPAGPPVSAAAAALPAGSRVTLRDASGAIGGSLYEDDPYSLVDWLPDGVPFVLPSTPTAPSGTVLGSSSISWTWAAVSGAQSYRVYSSSSGSLLAVSAATGAVVTGLVPASTHSIVVAGVARSQAGPLSAAATAHTRAEAPTGLALDALWASSATLSWSAGANPAGTFAELQRSTDAAAYAVRAGTRAFGAVDSDLLGCTSYYYRVRNRDPAGFETGFDGPLLVRTAASTPTPPGDLSAQSLTGRRIQLSWGASRTEGVTAYRLYKDSGTGTVDYSAPYAEFTGSVFSTTTVALSTGVLHRFGLRAVHRCGVEERNTHAVTAAWALESLDGVRAGIKVPGTGKRISGNRVLVMAELDGGDPRDAASVRFQFKSTAAAAWTDIPAANSNHPNPDTAHPYFVHWDVTGVGDGAYDLRAVAEGVTGTTDPAPGFVTVLVDPVGFEVRETDLGGGKVKKEQAVSNEAPATVAAAESGSAVVTKVLLPAGALDTTNATLNATVNPANTPAAPPQAVGLGAALEVTLSNGQTQLAGGQTAALVFNYPDDDGDGVIDGTQVRAERAEILYYDPAAARWKKEFATTLDATARTLTGRTPHFSLFAAFGTVATALDSIRVYPNPYKPNGGNPDEGRPFSRSDPLSGVIFDNLPASVRVTIYTLTGKEVCSLGTDNGTGALQWDARNDKGEDVATGVYFAVIKSPGQEPVVRKVGVIR